MYIKQCYNDQSIQYTGGIKFVSLITDKPVANGRRSEYSSPFKLPMDTQYSFSWQTRIPDDWESDDNWCVIAQIKPGSGPPVLAVELYGDDMQIIVRNDLGTHTIYREPMIRGEWLKFDIHMRLTTFTNGFYHLSVNGQSLVDFDGQTVMSMDGYHPYFKCGIYMSQKSKVTKRCIEHRI